MKIGAKSQKEEKRLGSRLGLELGVKKDKTKQSETKQSKTKQNKTKRLNIGQYKRMEEEEERKTKKTHIYIKMSYSNSANSSAGAMLSHPHL